MRPVGSQRSSTAATGSRSLWPAAQVSTIVRSAGLPTASTIAAASATVLMSGRLARAPAARCSRRRRRARASSPAAAKHRCARASAVVAGLARPGSAAAPASRAPGTLPPSSAQRPISRRITSTVRARTASSALVIESPFGASSSQCSPVIARPASAVARRIAARSCGDHDVRLVRERERRELEPVVADARRELALPRERHRREYLVAERDLHAPALPNTSVFARAIPARTAALNAGTYISTVNTVIAASTAQIGRVKNGVKLAVRQDEAAAQALVEDVAEHEAEDERRHRVVLPPQQEHAMPVPSIT